MMIDESSKWSDTRDLKWRQDDARVGLLLYPAQHVHHSSTFSRPDNEVACSKVRGIGIA